jgi:hypothetical protein
LSWSPYLPFSKDCDLYFLWDIRNKLQFPISLLSKPYLFFLVSLCPLLFLQCKVGISWLEF